MDKLRAMKSFVRIVEDGSLTAAAANLGVSLPSMVRTLAALERELGVTLLNRTTRRIHLTDDGRRYLEYCRIILANVQEAEGALRSSRAVPHGRLALTASVAFGQSYVASIVNEFLMRYPGATDFPGLIMWAAHSVSYDLTLMNAMSMGFSRDSCCTSEICNAGTLMECVSAGVSPDNCMPCARMYSTCSGHGSIKVTSSPPRAINAPV